MKIIGIIPARFLSSRFPAKPLADIAGKSMIHRVYTQAESSGKFSKVVVATDDKRIFVHVKSFGGDVCMTSPNHPSGTDRCYEALLFQDGTYDYVVNIQGDEPFISPLQIGHLISVLDGNTELATLAKKITDTDQLFNSNVVKVVTDAEGFALYFSRSPIPHARGTEMSQWLTRVTYYKHIGMYGYRADTLGKISALKPTPLERTESLEQLRWLEHGYRIRVAETDIETIGVDTPEDLEMAIAFATKK
jgi:3-deoxy-manno-octulosonate cytidylyltransferase (CMP-KDO synthetase)